MSGEHGHQDLADQLASLHADLLAEGARWTAAEKVHANLLARVASLEAIAPPVVPPPVTPPVPPVTPPVTPPTVRTLYGPAFAMDTLANLQCGGPDAGVICHRFRAEQSATLTAVRTWLKNMGTVAPGYGAGDGGTIEITVQTDNGGVPSGTVLATTLARPGAADSSGVNPGRFGLWTFTTPATLTAGNLYHLVYRNTAANPVGNFCSVNGTYTYNPASPRQPKWPDTDFAMGMKLGSRAWACPFTGHGGSYTPIVDITYGNGAHQGSGYLDPELGISPVISGTSMARERFTVSGGPRTVSSVAVRMAKAGGSGPLLVRLEDSSGTLIDSCTIPTTTVPTLSRTADASAGVWVNGAFASPRILADGSTYNLRLSTDASTSLWSRSLKQGGPYGFDPVTFFADGVLQKTTDGSTWSTVTSGDRADLQFYLT